jgi:hypothetical protein
MKLCNRTMLAALVAIAILAGRSFGQIPIGGPGPLPQNQPIYSPYLNMLRSGNSPTVNYFGLVRPELNATSALYNLQQQNVNTQQNLDQLQAGALPATGHPAQFLNLGGYFQSSRGGGLLGGNAQGAGVSQTRTLSGTSNLGTNNSGTALGPIR